MATIDLSAAFEEIKSFIEYTFENHEITNAEGTQILQYIVVAFILSYSKDARTAIMLLNDKEQGFFANVNKTIQQAVEEGKINDTES